MMEHVFIELAHQYTSKHRVQRHQRDVHQVDVHIMTYNAARELSHYHHLSKEQHLVLLLASCFLNHGTCMGNPSLLEKQLRRLSQFQQLHYISSQLVQQVSRCMQNSFNDLPETLLDRILCDAMNYHLSNYSYVHVLDKEEEQGDEAGGRRPTQLEWVDSAIDKLSAHKYYTTYAQRHFYPGIKQNLQHLRTWIHQQGLFYLHVMM